MESYRLEMKCLTISKNIHDRSSLRREAENVLKNLAGETGDCAYLVISSGTSATAVDRFSGGNLLQLSAPIGTLPPFHIIGAAPKPLRAFMPDEQREQILSHISLTCLAPNAITGKDVFHKTLDEIRQFGYSVDEQDFEVGVYAFGAPVYDQDGNVVAGLSIITPSARYSTERRRELFRLVIAAAKRLSEKLGYHSNRQDRCLNSGTGIMLKKIELGRPRFISYPPSICRKLIL